MAEIPVERKEKSSFPLWLIPLLLLLPLLYFLYRGCDRTTVVDNTNTTRNVNVSSRNDNQGGRNSAANGIINDATTSNSSNVSAANNAGGNIAIVVNNNSSAGAATGGTVTAVNYYGTVTDKNTIVGRNVDWKTVRVDRVLSDKVFTVKSENQELFVMLDEGLDSGGNEKAVKIRAGKNLKLAGAFKAVPSGEVKAETQGGGLNAKEFAQMKDQKVYLHATSISEVR